MATQITICRVRFKYNIKLFFLFSCYRKTSAVDTVLPVLHGFRVILFRRGAKSLREFSALYDTAENRKEERRIFHAADKFPEQCAQICIASRSGKV